MASDRRGATGEERVDAEEAEPWARRGRGCRATGEEVLAVSVAERGRRTTEATGASMREEAEPRALRCRGRRATGEERGGDGEPPEQHGGEERNGGRRRRSGSSRASPRERIWRRMP